MPKKIFRKNDCPKTKIQGEVVMLKNIIIIMSLIGMFGCGSTSDTANALAQNAESTATECVAGDINLGQPDGCYLLSGGLSVKVSAPKILSLTATAPHMEIVGVKVVFLQPAGGADNFVLILPPLSSGGSDTELLGTWAKGTKPNSFTVRMTGLTDMIGSSANIQMTKHVFTGKVRANGTIKGAFSLAAKISGLATISISSSNYTGEPQTSEAAKQNLLIDELL
jgi:hypothetical protein